MVGRLSVVAVTATLSVIATASNATAEPLATSAGRLATSPGPYLDCPADTLDDGRGYCEPLGPPGSAAAITDYLHALNLKGVTYTSADGAIALARDACSSINAGADFATVQLNIMRTTGLSYPYAARVIVESIIFFCPDGNDDIFHQAQDAEFS